MDIPSAPTVNLDDYALLPADQQLPEVTVVGKGARPGPGKVVRINTGQALPQGTDALIMVEDTELVSEGSDGEEERIRLLTKVAKGENMRMAGSDVQKGTVVLPSGTRISRLGGELGTLIFFGITQIKVVNPPVVALLSTGDQLEDLDTTKESLPGARGLKIYDTNRPSLRSVLRDLGLWVVDLGIQKDQKGDLAVAMKKAIHEADVVVSRRVVRAWGIPPSQAAAATAGQHHTLWKGSRQTGKTYNVCDLGG